MTMVDILDRDTEHTPELESGEETGFCYEQGYLTPPMQSIPSVLPQSRLPEPGGDIMHDLGKPLKPLYPEEGAEFRGESNAIAMVELPPTESRKRRAIILFLNGTFRGFHLNTMKPAGPFRNPHKRSRTTAISCLDATTVVSGGWDGTIAVSDAITGERYWKSKEHEGDIVTIDAWDDCIVSAERTGRNLKFFRFKDGKLQVVSEIQLERYPSVVKIVKIDNKLHAFVAFQYYYSRIHLYTMDGCFQLLDVSGGRSKGSFILEDVALNATRTRYAAVVSHRDAVSSDTYMRITTGSFNSVLTTKNYISCGNFSDSKITWGWKEYYLYVSDNLGKVYVVPLEGPTDHYLSAHKGRVNFLHVFHSDEVVRLYTGGTDRKVLLWNR